MPPQYEDEPPEADDLDAVLAAFERNFLGR